MIHVDYEWNGKENAGYVDGQTLIFESRILIFTCKSQQYTLESKSCY